VKCTYCRSEFQQTSKGSTSPICKKCEQNVKQFGKPRHCEFCNILAAFIGQKCQRCTNYERKYGPPVVCEQCKQRSAFDKKSDEQKVDGKLLCFFCTLSCKRALLKTKQTDPIRHSHVKLGSNSKLKEHKKIIDKRPQREDVTKLSGADGGTPSKQSRTESKKEDIKTANSAASDHLVALTQLRETIGNLQRQLAQKDKDLLAKDRQITELKAANFTTETECRNKLRTMQQDHDGKVEKMSMRIKQLQKDVASLSKNQKNKSSLTILKSERERSSSGGEDSS